MFEGDTMIEGDTMSSPFHSINAAVNLRPECNKFTDSSANRSTSQLPAMKSTRETQSKWICSIRLMLTAMVLAVFAQQADLQRVSAQGRTNPKLQGLLENSITEFALAAESLEALKGSQADVLLANGDVLTEMTIVDFSGPKNSGLLKSIRFKEGERARTRSYAPRLIYNLVVDGKEYRVRNLASRKAHVLVNIDQQRKAIEVRLRSQRQALWKESTESEQKADLEEHRDFLKRVQSHFSALPMMTYETNYFVFCTDMPKSQIAPYLKKLDAMNEQLGAAFGFAPGRNIWKGKAVIVAFIEQVHFVEFEKTFMNYDVPSESIRGLCHSKRDGNVIVGCWRGDSPDYFAIVLVHETAHGYVHRFKSTVAIPSWINEGISDWIADAVVTQATDIKYREKTSAQRVKQMGGIGVGFFSLNTQTIEGWHYGIASRMVRMMVSASPENFRLFIDGVKEGRTWQDSLLRAYGMTPEQLMGTYERSVGLQR